MKKVITTTTRKIYTQSPSPQVGTTTIRRLNNNSSSDGTSPVILNAGTPRILKQATITRHLSVGQQQQLSSGISINSSSGAQLRCYVCDGQVGGQGSLLMETQTNLSHTKLPNKISRVIGDAFLVIVRADDIVCRRCVNLFNDVDRLESELERAKGQLMSFICKKYAIDDAAGDAATRGPAAKVQKVSTDHLDVSVSPQAVTPTATTTVKKVISVGGNSAATTTISSPTGVGLTPNGPRRAPVKIYKCMSCEFTTGDLKQFTPHYNVCPGVAENNGTASSVTAVVSSAAASNNNSSSVHNSPANTPSPATKVLGRRPVTQTLQQAASSAKQQEYACTMCQYKSRDKQTFDEHVRRHIRAKPFKCRICEMRFETWETASKHARTHSTEYYKCGTCQHAFKEREALVKHFEVHQKDGSGGQQIIIKAHASTVPATLAATTGTRTQQPPASTQKGLQEAIDEALSESAPDTLDEENIHFFSCGICSLTFIQENYYTQHMATHKRESASATSKRVAAKAGQLQTGAAATKQTSTMATRNQKTNGQSLIKAEVNDDLESIFEKMHSDKTGGDANASGATDENADSQTGIDMPALDQGEEVHDEQSADTGAGGPPVSMPSLDDDGENSEQQGTGGNTSAEGGEPMEIEDMHNSGEGGEQLKFIVNENGQLLQLDNHILTDAEGNQIIVQGADSEHFQQLLQSVAGLEGGTIQMIQGENNQMILVQQGDNEPQLIDASLLNADGQIVIQQGGGEGEMSVDGHSQSSEDVAAAQQQQEQEDHQQGEYEAGDEAVAVLAAAAEQHHLQATAANSEEAAAVDTSGQEDLEAQIAVHTVATTSRGSRGGGGEDTSMQSDDNSQEATTTAGDAPVSGSGVGTVDSGGGDGKQAGGASEDDASQESHDQGAEEEKKGKEGKKGDKEEDAAVSTTTTDEKISSSTKEGYRFF